MQDLNPFDPLNKRGIKKTARRHQLREFQKEIAEKTFRSEGKNTAPDIYSSHHPCAQYQSVVSWII